MDFGLPLEDGCTVGPGDGDFVLANGLPRFCGEVEDILRGLVEILKLNQACRGREATSSHGIINRGELEILEILERVTQVKEVQPHMKVEN